MAVKVTYFNPRKAWKHPIWGRLPGPRLNNFGDLIGPILVERILRERSLRQPRRNRRLLAVGSILKLAQPGDVIWGAGINGKSMDAGAAPNVDVRAVRGPLSRDVLLRAGASVPEVFGDPALLWSQFWSLNEYRERRPVQRRPVGFVPNFHDLSLEVSHRTISPIGAPHDVIAQIAGCDFVCGSSLHGIVIAESFGIPARLVRSPTEPIFKYQDYYAGTGRKTVDAADSIEHAIEMGGAPEPKFDAEVLLEAFPDDIYDKVVRAKKAVQTHEG